MILKPSAVVLALVCAFACHPAQSTTVFPVETTEQLIHAIHEANRTPEADIISLERGLYVLKAISDESRKSAFPEISSPIVIRGNGAELRRYSDLDFRVFHVGVNGHLRLERVVLAEASLGAIRNHGVAELRHVALVDSTARGASAIVENHGEMRVEHGDVSFNTVAGASTDAGTIVNWGKLWLTSTNFQGNHLTRRFPGAALASTLLNYGTAEFDDVRISGNVSGDIESDGAPQAPLVNLGNGHLELRQVREHDNLPGETLVARLPAP